MPLRDKIERGQTGDLTGWSSLVPRNRRQHLGWGLRGLWLFFFFFFWLVGGEATELCSRNLVFSLKLPYSTWVGAPVTSLSRVRLFATPWTVAYQAPQPMEFSRQEYLSGLPFLPPGDLSNPGMEPGSPALQAEALTIWATSEDIVVHISLSRNQDPVWRLYHHLTVSPLFLYSLPSLISNHLNPPFGTQGRSRRLNEAYILQLRNGEHTADLYSRVATPQSPAQF